MIAVRVLLVVLLGFGFGVFLSEYLQSTSLSIPSFLFITDAREEAEWQELMVEATQLELKKEKEEEEKDQHVEMLDFREFGRRLTIFKRLFGFMRGEEKKNYIRTQQLLATYSKAGSKNSVARLHYLHNQNSNNNNTTVERGRQALPSSSSFSSLLFDLERDLFPWLHSHRFPTLLALTKSFQQERGIVIPAGSRNIRFAHHLIRSLRFVNCTLPIIIAYAGNNDLDQEERDYLREKMHVRLLDVAKYFDNALLKLKGFEIKPFALLAAPFQEVILMDADCVILRNPEELFSDEDYLTHHAILFRDRTAVWADRAEKQQKWFETQMPLPLSESVVKSRMYNGKTGFEIESGLVVWNKQHRLFGLLAACKMNAWVERTQFYDVFLGDKEAFWLGLELVRETFTDMQQSTPAAIGILEPNGPSSGEWVCSTHIFHLDREGRPLWFNAGIVADKYSDKHELKNFPGQFTHWAVEGVWVWNTHNIPCLNGTVRPLGGTLSALIRELIRLWA